MNQLRVYEEITLLALHDDKGTVGMQAMHNDLGIAAAGLMELISLGRLDIDESDDKAFVEVLDATPTGDPVLDEMLDRIASANKRSRMKSWVQKLSRTRQLRHTVAAQLVAHGVLTQEESKFLIFFERAKYPEIDPTIEAGITERIRMAITTDAEVDDRTAMLVTVASATDLLKNNFSKAELKTAKARIAQITEGDAVGAAARNAVNAAVVGALAGAGVI